MPTNPDLVERSGDLKGELIAFALRPRYDRALRQAIDEHFGRRAEVNEADFANLLDWFILQKRLPGGRTVVEHFVAARPDLPEEERGMLLGWRDVVEGIFAVTRRDGGTLVMVNLVDELTYHAVSNMGPASVRPLQPGTFLIGRLVPVGDEWMMSGVSSVLPAERRAEAYRLATDLGARRPELVFRNPEKLAQAWELQRKERGHFIAFFGADQVVLPGRELAERMHAYSRFRLYEVRNDEGKTGAEQIMETHGQEPTSVDFQLEPATIAAETVGVIFDEVDGLNFFTGFGEVADVFANPALAARREHRQAVLAYLQEPSISPLPFRRLAEQDAGRASQVFQRMLKQRDFSWERDGEALLRRYKRSFFEQPVLPSLTVVNDPATVVSMIAESSGEVPPERGRPARWGMRGAQRP